MKFSRNWIQDHIEEKMPTSTEFCDVFSKKALEIEGVEEVNGDIIYDIKVLPHRQHDCFSHRGIAREIATLFSLPRKERSIVHPETIQNSKFKIQNSDAKLCPRYIGVRVDCVSLKASPENFKIKLESIGQRSVSAIVDITNFVMNDIGQPMHAFDADKVIGGITVRLAQEGERMTTLDGKEITMKGIETVIADDEGVLALAGVKGGTKAIVDENTKSIIFESANFNATATRKSSDLHNIKTDASKRYEAGMTSELAGEAIDYALQLIKEIYPDCAIGEVIDIYEKKERKYKVGVSVSEINSLLGTDYAEEKISQTLKQLNFENELIPPLEKIENLITESLDKPYKLGASVLFDGGEAFDCSSFVSWVYKEVGVSIPRVSVDQFVFASKISQEELKFGDLIFANSEEGKIYYETVDYKIGAKVPEGVDHVGFYIGHDEVIHATRKKGFVVKEKISESESFKKIVGYGRIIENENKRFVSTIPFERLDVRIKVDMIEEIGRVIGYDEIKSELSKLNRVGLPHKRLYYETKIKNILIKNGFSEIITYTFGNKGDVQIVKGLASDKEKLRTNLSDGVKDAIVMNLHNAPLLGEKVIKVFEFGNVFSENGEVRNFAIGIDDGAKKSNFTESVEFILLEIKRTLNIHHMDCTTGSSKPYVVEINFDKLIESLPEPKDYEPLSQIETNVSYKPISLYPFIVRDIACFTPSGTEWETVLDIINKNDSPLIIRRSLFDTFNKTFEDGTIKISYAFRLVIQSFEKTLTDEDANEIASKTYEDLKEKGYEIR